MDTLFPITTDKEKAELALAEIRKVLGTERKMREWVFRKDPDQKAKKVREIDGAIKSVGVIEGILHRVGVFK